MIESVIQLPVAQRLGEHGIGNSMHPFIDDKDGKAQHLTFLSPRGHGAK
jgi:hypothetical protein